MADEERPVNSMSPEQFRELVSGASDEEILQGIHGAGTEEALDRIFQGFEERFLPERAQGVTADVQWVVIDEGTEHPYHLRIADGKCTAQRGRAEGDPRVTLTTDIASFAKLVTGNAQGPALFMSGKLKLQGDMMFSMQMNNYFQRPGE